ncbi:MAG: hypothetical protein DF168_01786 [Candidatus Moanabacter tarae]|uniref:Uncharacterized protein n=1 Tax=Candidatus Moanibacter tarae TaxID=2200854 RepID=A0A2Z4AEI1_9BACT|nr:MAG: hypothetical protein DF168_01786 [Candidatus Moanabacter tarae]|tara:strand:+ start:625 stop:1038 length:414 start_codon:yes stop_codon:yes gene_type:complete
MGPRFVNIGGTQNKIDEGTESGTKGFSVKSHIGFIRQPIALLRIAANARGYHVLPGCLSTPVSRNDMVQITPSISEYLTTILTCMAIPFEEVMTSEFYLFHRQPKVPVFGINYLAVILKKNGSRKGTVKFASKTLRG